MPQIILKERTAHLASCTFFTRDVDQYKDASLSQLYQRPIILFSQNMYHYIYHYITIYMTILYHYIIKRTKVVLHGGTWATQNWVTQTFGSTKISYAFPEEANLTSSKPIFLILSRKIQPNFLYFLEKPTIIKISYTFPKKNNYPGPFDKTVTSSAKFLMLF